MPPSKPKPSDIAAEAKRAWFPYILERFIDTTKSTSFSHPESSFMCVDPNKKSIHRTRVAVLEGDPVTHALGWYQSCIQNSAYKDCKRIPVVNGASETRAGGDWESGATAPEECFARRSNLVQALTMPWKGPMGRNESHYPIPQEGGIYCPEVYVFRGGPDMDYTIFQEMEHLPVISVAPVRGPRLKGGGTIYSFFEEQEHMKRKMRTVLRIAAYYNHENLVIGTFGLGPNFRNPAREVAIMWRGLLYQEEEFRGVFQDVVFCIDSDPVGPPANAKDSDFAVFKDELSASKIFPTQYS